MRQLCSHMKSHKSTRSKEKSRQKKSRPARVVPLPPGHAPRTLPDVPPRLYKKDCPELREIFLSCLREGYSPAKACAHIGMTTRSVWGWRYKDEEFAKRWIEAARDGVDKLEDEAVRRAHDGTNKPVYQGGVLVGHVIEYSDTLMLMMLKGRRPEVYRDKMENGEGQVSVTIKGGLPRK